MKAAEAVDRLFTPEAGDAVDAVALVKRALPGRRVCEHICVRAPYRREESTYGSLYAIVQPRRETRLFIYLFIYLRIYLT